MKRLLATSIIASLLLGSCVHSRPQTAVKAETREWRQFANPEAAGFDRAELESLRSFADQSKSAAVFAVADGNVVASWGAVDRKLEVRSVRKSLYSALWGIAEARGLVKLNATLGELGVDDVQPLTAEEKKARIVDLLHARSGVYLPAAYAPSDMEAALPARGSHAPDTFWYYNNWDFNVAGALLERLSGKPMGVLFNEWIAQPLGMEDYDSADVIVVREPRTSRWPALTFRMSARDLARFGQMWMSKGRWDGQQIVPAEWIERASTPASVTDGEGNGYGMLWWIYGPDRVSAQRYPNASKVRIIMARGNGGQAVAVIPEAGLVVVHRGDVENGRRVAGPVIWTIIDRLLGARHGGARRDAPLTALKTEPFDSQLPPFAWPEAIALDRTAMNNIVGDYQVQPGAVAHVYVDNGHLYGSFPGLGEAELFAKSPTEIFVRVDSTTRITLERNGDGPVRSLKITSRGREFAATRLDSRR